MKITPLDVKKHEFAKAFRGYDSDEVRAFLEMVSEEMAAMRDRIEELQKQAVRMETQLVDYKELEQKWKTTMISAQESAERAVETSRKEAEIIHREAEIKAESILGEARKKAAKFREELELLRAEKRSFVRRLKHLVSSQLELIDVLEKDDDEEPEDKAARSEESE